MGPVELEPIIGLEVHAELQTRSKMFCACQVVDPTQAEPNSAVCPVCAGMPGVLPVVNQRAVEFALRVALALRCEVAHTSLFARKNYFYPDLPKGYQISQYESPLARNGSLTILTSSGDRLIRIRRVHLEEDTAKLTHIDKNGTSYSLIDLNRAGIPLLEIVSEPDLRTAEEVRAYATGLRSILRYLGVNSGDMQKGAMRIEPNISVRASGSQLLGTRTEIKNLNSFRALERSVAYEIQRQSALIRQGKEVLQQTMGWDEALNRTVAQRSKEEAHDYRYFPEPDLPPLVVEQAWIDQIQAVLPELPAEKSQRLVSQYGLKESDAAVLASDPPLADYFETAAGAAPGAAPRAIANWIIGELFALLNQMDQEITSSAVSPTELAALVKMVEAGEINQTTAKVVLAEMFTSPVPASAKQIVTRRGLSQISDRSHIAGLVTGVLEANPEQVSTYLEGKETISQWLFGQVMRAAQGKANPQVIREELDKQLAGLKDKQ
jgi:aspartyl-tRNA(Asn)/glutamyl-tRNA(Gln) amidotransferase subunit B